MFAAMPSCGLCSGFAHRGRSPPRFQFPLPAATLESDFKNVVLTVGVFSWWWAGVLVLAFGIVVFSVGILCPGSGKAKEGKCQKLKPSVEENELSEVRFDESSPQVWLLDQQLGSSSVCFFSAGAQLLQVFSTSIWFIVGVPSTLLVLLGFAAGATAMLIVFVGLVPAAKFAYVGLWPSTIFPPAPQDAWYAQEPPWHFVRPARPSIEFLPERVGRETPKP